MTEFRSIELASLPKHFDATDAEKRWDEVWQKSRIYHYDPERPRSETFVVDTPPPTASGALHPGHVFSYTHTDILVRYKRMTGKNIFFPIGWDDNGLPTERRVQNFYHIRCDPTVPKDPDLELEEATAKVRKKPPRKLSRPDFIDACEAVTRQDETSFRELWMRLGLSYDWRQEYQTIDAHCRRIAQYSFLDLSEKGHIYTSYAPTMWDVDFQCAIAQAELEERTVAGAYHDIEFAVDGGGSFTIATTRPELLAACVGVTAHPGDARYKGFFGKRATTPLFRASVPIFPSEKADPEKGTGILMVCSFGDATDVEWWRQEGLDLRLVVQRDGRIAPIEWGSEGYASADVAMAQRFYDELTGKNMKQARIRVVEQLRLPEGSATGSGAPLQREPRDIEHSVKFYEKGDRPLEFLPTRQWFVRLLPQKQALLRKGAAIAWHPPHMHKRFQDWTENLSLDWCISRQRYFGVPIPAWFALDANGERDYDAPILPAVDRLPIDPTTDTPPGYQESQREQPGGFSAETDIFDTWFTSSLSPQISSHWTLDETRHRALFPADLRPQGHDIIRTWAFYTIAKAMLHEDALPWSDAAISGWVLDPDRKKMSKSKGNVTTPMPLLEQFSADAVRYWSGSARLGADTAIDEKVFKVGKRLVTKLFNAGKFVLSQTGTVHPIASELDLAFAAKLRALCERATRAFEDFNHAQVLQEAEGFFWSQLADSYLELSKLRARDEDPAAEAARGSAVATLRLGLSVLLRLLAPFVPYIAEEVWSWSFAQESGHPSIHRAPWPSEADFEGLREPADAESFDLAVAAWGAINKAKSDASVSMGREVARLTISANRKTLERLAPVLSDVLGAARCAEHRLEASDSLENGEFAISDAEFADRPEK